jgi:hypothetical protein
MIAFAAMAAVFGANPSIVYPNPVVNVLASNGTVNFYVRCDVAQYDDSRKSILEICNITEFSVVPVCAQLYNYYTQAYTFGSVSKCPTGYLQAITSTVNLSVNLIAFAMSVMIIGAVAMFVVAVVMCVIR